MSLALLALKQGPFPGVDNGQFIEYVFFTVVAVGNYSTGGDTCDFTQLGDLLKSGQTPLQVTIQSQSAASGHSGYQYYYRPGNAQNNGKMQVMTSNSVSGQPLVELAAGPYPAGVTGDTIVGIACFVRI